MNTSTSTYTLIYLKFESTMFEVLQSILDVENNIDFNMKIFKISSSNH